MMIELRRIRYFLAVAEERHLTRAAAKIGTGQPQLSQQIKDLEAENRRIAVSSCRPSAELTSAGDAVWYWRPDRRPLPGAGAKILASVVQAKVVPTLWRHGTSCGSCSRGPTNPASSRAAARDAAGEEPDEIDPSAGHKLCIRRGRRPRVRPVKARTSERRLRMGSGVRRRPGAKPDG